MDFPIIKVISHSYVSLPEGIHLLPKMFQSWILAVTKGLEVAGASLEDKKNGRLRDVLSYTI